MLPTPTEKHEECPADCELAVAQVAKNPSAAESDQAEADQEERDARGWHRSSDPVHAGEDQGEERRGRTEDSFSRRVDEAETPGEVLRIPVRDEGIDEDERAEDPELSEDGVDREREQGEISRSHKGGLRVRRDLRQPWAR